MMRNVFKIGGRKKAFTLIELPAVRKRAFTLIELLIVIAIIGILATLIFVNVNIARKKARDAKRMADLKNLQTTLEMYNQETGSYPSTSNAWWGNDSAHGSHPLSGSTGWVPSIAPTYVTTLPVDPLASSSGYYNYRGNGTDYKLRACPAENMVATSNAFYDPTAATCFQISSSATSLAW